MQDLLAAVEPGSPLHDTYVESARSSVENGGPVEDAFRSWRRLVRETSGDVFRSVEGESGTDAGEAEGPAATDAFVATLYYDLVVDSLLDVVASRTGTGLANRDPRRNTDGLEVPLATCHDHLRPADARERVAATADGEPLSALTAGLLGDLYRRVVPRPVRLALGQYDTPPGLAEVVLDALPGGVGDPDCRVLDPGCGTGALLAAALARKRDGFPADDPGAVVSTVLDTVVGIDLNPVAVKSAKLVVLCALADELAATDGDRVSVPVFLTDALGLARDEAIRFRGRTLDVEFDTLVGNPPWIPWSRLPERTRDRWRERYVDDLGLQPHGGVAARLGHSNDDVSVPFAWTCIHRYLRAGGTASFVLKRDITRGPAGTVLRRLRVGDRPLALRRVHDFAALDPFPSVGANAAVYAFAADRDNEFPVETTVWRPREGTTPDYTTGDRIRATTRRRETTLAPLSDDPTTAWVRADAERAALGECAHEIRHGVKDDAQAVFGVDDATLDSLENEYVYPYLKSRHVVKYGVVGHDRRLVPQRVAGEDNEDRLRTAAPATYEYLQSHRDRLEGRASSWFDDGPFYSVFGLGPYTWAPYKVVWCRLGFKPDFAVVSTRNDDRLGEKQLVPGDHYMYVATEDRETAHYLCALLNSAPYQRTLRDLASDGKASLTKAVVSRLRLPATANGPVARRLAARSMQAHAVVAAHAADGKAACRPSARPKLAAIGTAVDRLVERTLTDPS